SHAGLADEHHAARANGFARAPDHALIESAPLGEQGGAERRPCELRGHHALEQFASSRRALLPLAAVPAHEGLAPAARRLTAAGARAEGGADAAEHLFERLRRRRGLGGGSRRDLRRAVALVVPLAPMAERGAHVPSPTVHERPVAATGCTSAPPRRPRPRGAGAPEFSQSRKLNGESTAPSASRCDAQVRPRSRAHSARLPASGQCSTSARTTMTVGWPHGTENGRDVASRTPAHQASSAEPSQPSSRAFATERGAGVEGGGDGATDGAALTGRSPGSLAADPESESEPESESGNPPASGDGFRSESDGTAFGVGSDPPPGFLFRPFLRFRSYSSRPAMAAFVSLCSAYRRMRIPCTPSCSSLATRPTSSSRASTASLATDSISSIGQKPSSSCCRV